MEFRKSGASGNILRTQRTASAPQKRMMSIHTGGGWEHNTELLSLISALAPALAMPTTTALVMPTLVFGPASS